MTTPELRPLTSLRGLFAWGVVAYHLRLACSAWLAPGVIAVLAKGYLAVDLFFLLSGFVIWLNYGARLEEGGWRTTADFLVRRIARIWPLHAVMLGFAAALALLLIGTGRAAGEFPFALLPLHLLLMQDWGFADALAWNDPAWSISAEWAAYLIVPLVAFALPRRERWPVPLLLASIAAPLLLLHAAIAAAGGIKLGHDLSHFGVLRCLTEFSAGTVLCELWRRWRGRAAAEAGAWAACALCFAAWGLGAAETLAVPFAFAALLLAVALGAERPRHPLSGRAIHWLGEVSYATYLSHFLLFFAFKLAVVRDARDVSPGLMLLFMLLELGVSAALYRGVEKPAQRAIRRGWAARSHRRDRAADAAAVTAMPPQPRSG